MQKIEPSVSVDLWTSKPDAAEALMNSDSKDAADYTTAGWLVAGGIMMTLITNLAIKYGAGPFSGIVDMAMKAWKSGHKAKDEHSPDPQYKE